MTSIWKEAGTRFYRRLWTGTVRGEYFYAWTHSGARRKYVRMLRKSLKDHGTV